MKQLKKFCSMGHIYMVVGREQNLIQNKSVLKGLRFTLRGPQFADPCYIGINLNC